MKDLVKCKSVIEHYIGSNAEKVFQFILNGWRKLEEVLNILKIFYDLTIELQRVNYTLSDFYGQWLLCELKLQKIISNVGKETNLCEKFIWSMNKRKNDVIQNRAMLCAVFLDPRYRSKLTTSEIALVKHLLEDAWVQTQLLKKEISSGGDLQEAIEEGDLLESLFAPTDVSSENLPINAVGQCVPDYTKSKAEFMIIVNNYELNTKRIHHSKSIHEFWKNSKETYPELYEVATIYLGIPPTQSTVERSFSTLSYIYNNRRSRLSPNTLENIIMLKLNADLALNIFQEEINEI